ncbi:MAG: glycosyltransferase [Bauldia sp.]|nr:glycosyltransferase [Bauldia sp.]
MTRTILIIFMTEEEPATAWTIGSLLGQLEDGDTLLLLHNGASDRSFADKYAVLPRVRYFEHPENLGVAGGRNFLLRQPECVASDLVFLVDSDTVVPNDYLRNMTAFIGETPDAGVVGAVLLRFDRFRKRLDSAGFSLVGWDGPIPRATTGLDTAAIRDMTRGALGQNDLDHIGAAPDWRRAYLSPEDFLEMVQKLDDVPGEGNFFGMLKYATESRARLSGGPAKLEVSNVAGGCQVFRRSLLDEIGYLCDLFNPYGFEDVDFCIRALSRGWKNYTTNASYVLHRTDLRHAKRTSVRNRLRSRCNHSRAHTILESRWAGSEFPALTFRRLFGRYLVLSERGDAREDFLADLFGIRAAFGQLAEQEDPRLLECLLAAPPEDSARSAVAHIVQNLKGAA